MKFLCPRCRRLLEEKADALDCQCGAVFYIIDGIPLFAEIDPFYEGRWKTCVREEAKLHLGEFLYINFSKDTFPMRYRFVKKNLRHCPKSPAAVILDLGCGGGWEIFSKSGTTVGVDISVSSLENAKSIYNQCVQADITKPLPFEDQAFDFISSKEVLEHIACTDKDKILGEAHRVLKNGGKALFIFETIGVFHRLARRISDDCYNKYLVEAYGHVGLERPGEAIARLRNSGFKILRIEKHFSLLFPIGILLEYLDNDYKKKSVVLEKFVKTVKFISRYPRFAEIVNFCALGLQEIFEIFLPPDAGSSLCVICEKE